MVAFEREAEAGCDARVTEHYLELPYQRLLSFFSLFLLTYDYHERRSTCIMMLEES